MSYQITNELEQTMKILALAAVVLVGSFSAFSAEQFRTTYEESLNCNGPKMLCFCSSEKKLQKIINDTPGWNECRDFKDSLEGTNVRVVGTSVQKSFSDGGDRLHCSYKITFECE